MLGGVVSHLLQRCASLVQATALVVLYAPRRHCLKSHPKEKPIGLMPSIVRVWERMRKPLLDQWMISQTGPCDWAFNWKYGAITSKIAKTCRMPSGPTRIKAMRTQVGRCLPGTEGDRSRGGSRCTSATRFVRAESSPLQRGRRQFGTISWTTRNCTRHGKHSNNWWV